jgi:hypothetical protein
MTLPMLAEALVKIREEELRREAERERLVRLALAGSDHERPRRHIGVMGIRVAAMLRAAARPVTLRLRRQSTYEDEPARMSSSILSGRR